MFNLGAFGKFLTIFSVADRAVRIAATFVHASNEEKKQTAVGIVHATLDTLAAKGKIPALTDELFNTIAEEVDGAVELAYTLRKHGPALPVAIAPPVAAPAAPVNSNPMPGVVPVPVVP